MHGDAMTTIAMNHGLDTTWRGNVFAFLGVTVVLLGSVAYSYPLFHSLVELFTVVIALLAGVVGWHTFPFARNHFLLFLAAGYFWVGVADLFHALSYKGISVFPPDGGNRATQFWLVGRYLEAVLLFAAPFFLQRPLPRTWPFFGFAGATLVLGGLVLTGAFPTAFDPRTGLTPFKVVSEYVLMAVLAGALLHLALHRKALDPLIGLLLGAAILFTIGSEFAFTLYRDPYGFENFLGHLAKLVSYWLVFFAVVETTHSEPFRWLARGANSFDVVPFATAVLDQGGRVLHTNPAARRHAGSGDESRRGWHCHGLFHPAGLAQEKCPVCQAIAHGVAGETNFELAFPERGAWHRVTLAPVTTPQGSRGFVHLSRDITQRKAAEEALAVRHDELASILASVGDAVFGIDLQGRATYVNTAFERLTGWHEGEAIGRNSHRLLHHTRADSTPFPEAECPIFRTLEDGTLARREDDLFWRKDGASFPVDYTASAVRDRSGTLKGAVVVLRDITERKALDEERRRHREELEREVAERTAELRALNQELESFSYSVSHDLRGPLRAIDGFSQVLEEDYADRLDADARGYLQRMRGAAARMTDLLDGLLVLSRVTRRELALETLDLSGLTREVAEELSEGEPDRAVEWRIEPGLTARGDPTLVRLLLQNLLGNAWKFTGGRERAVIEFGRRSTRRGEAFYVRDNGAGFDMQHADALFRPFHRLHGVDEYAGTGIGLATVHRIIQRHNGGVWADGTPDQGATFYFTLS